MVIAAAILRLPGVVPTVPGLPHLDEGLGMVPGEGVWGRAAAAGGGVAAGAGHRLRPVGGRGGGGGRALGVGAGVPRNGADGHFSTGTRREEIRLKWKGKNTEPR